MVSSTREKVFQTAALLLVLFVGIYFRFTGLMWGDYEYEHPDERFLVWVVADIAPVNDLAEYFETQVSTLNPANRGHTFYVYGDFPVILTRYMTEWVTTSVGWEQVLQVGRGLSAVFDLLTVGLVFLTAQRLVGWRTATLAGLLSAATVLQIQQAHFFTVDSFATMFTTLAVYLAVLLATEDDGLERRAVYVLALAFGAAVGLAMACKLNTFLVAFLLPAALGLRFLRVKPGGRLSALVFLALAAAAGGTVAFLVFRVAQPYAFSGPNFYNILPDPGWMKSIRDLGAQSAGDVDFPPALQWARRPVWFSLQNLALWGMGLPQALLAWTGFFLFAWAALRRLRVEKLAGMAAAPWSGLLLVWAWTAFYFTWQSLAWNPTMRYQLPIYPTLTLLAAWGAARLWDLARAKPAVWRRLATGAALGLVLLLTLAWAFAFTRIYNRTETRVAASHWIFANVPGPVNLTIDTPSGANEQRVSMREQVTVHGGFPYLTPFDVRQAGALDALVLPSLQVVSSESPSGAVRLRARVYAPADPQTVLAGGEVTLPDGSYDNYELPLDGAVVLQTGQRLVLALEIVQPEPAAGSAIAETGYAAVQVSGQVSLRLYGRTAQARISSSALTLSNVRLEADGSLRRIVLAQAAPAPALLSLVINSPLAGETQTAQAVLAGGGVYRLTNPLLLRGGVDYLAAAFSEAPGEDLASGASVRLDFLDDPAVQLLPGLTSLARLDEPLWEQFTPQASGFLRQVTLGYAAQVDPQAGSVALVLDLASQSQPGVSLAQAQVMIDPAPAADARGVSYTLTLDPPVAVQEGQVYSLTLTPEQGAVAVHGSAPANESSWDMGLPFRMDGYDPFGGIYRNDLNLEMYWDDNVEKYQRFTNVLDQADYIFMSSNRQWGTTTRLPERHPLTTAFYRELLGCPEEKEVIWCYNVAEAGSFTGQLGFDLVETFTSYPNLGPVQINTQFAEEAFTVYDHPKVMLFRKRADYDPAQVRALLGQVDLQSVARITPKKAADYKDMLLPAWIWKAQQDGGTWAALFPPEGLQNRYPWLGLVLYYAFLWLLGLAVYPLLRLALPGLPDHGYPLARIAGMLLLAYPAWLGGSLGVPVTRLTLGIITAGLALLGSGLAFAQRGALAEEWRARKGYFLRVELIALALFCLSLLIRLGNPDLWHPVFGGEKPMNFSQFNAVLKSTLFPAYDAWFSGGALNYYYFGYVLVGMPVKLLGITPSVAYNLILPALFSMVGLAAFSVGWNVAADGADTAAEAAVIAGGTDTAAEVEAEAAVDGADTAGDVNGAHGETHLAQGGVAHTGPAGWHGPSADLRRRSPYTAGLAALVALLLIGNLGTVRMLWEGLQKLVVSAEQMNQGNVIEHWSWAVEGAMRLVNGTADRLPYYTGDWYWKPSRAIQPESGSEITEFPFFTFLYADLHAHLMALPLTLLGLSWALSAVLRRGRWPGRLSFGLSLLLGALVLGALRPANTWDQYTYLTLGCIALAFSQWQGAPQSWRTPMRRLAWALLPALGLALLALLLYRPFDWYFGQGYSELTPWENAKTGLGSYLVHWGVFLFVITAWLFDETLDWMASTPLSALNRLRPFRGAILAGLVFLLLIAALLLLRGVVIVLVAGPLGLAAALLLLRPGQPAAKRAVLFMIGSGLALTLAVELVAVKGDLARMNTVFKFYFQAWSLLSLSAAVGFAWLARKLPRMNAGWTAWFSILVVLLFSAGLYPITATNAKWGDRMTPDSPRTLDGMDYMAFSTYGDGPTQETFREMDLTQDYYAIRWVQQNIPGSPVIVEAHTQEYRHWGNRFTIYTGLPAVIGWNWHERQQRALTPETWIYNRITAVEGFYTTTNREQAEAFLRKYNVGVIVVAQLERIYYAGPGLDKFAALDGILWDAVYTDGETVIYRVKEK